MNYKKQKEELNKEKLDELLRILPAYCRDYFVYAEGTQDRPSSTMLAYAQEVRKFFDYMIKENPTLTCYDDISIDVLNRLTPKDIQEYMYYAKSHKDADGNTVTNSASTRSRKLSALRSFFKYLYAYSGLNMNPAAMVDSPDIKRKKQPRLNREEVSELLDSVETGNDLTDRQKDYALRSTLRDAAIMKLFLGTGIRVSELVGIDLGDIDWKNKEILIVRKGGDEDTIYIGDEIATALDDYIRFERQPFNDGEQALFVSSRTASRGRLSVRAVEKLVKKYGAATIKTKKLTPHGCRRTFGQNYYQETGDIRETADLMGHSEVSTTAKHYAETDYTKKSASVRKFSDELLKSE